MSPIVRDQIRQEVDLIEKCSTYYHRRLARLIDELTGSQVARRHRTSVGSVRVRCSRAVRRLAAHRNELLADVA